WRGQDGNHKDEESFCEVHKSCFENMMSHKCGSTFKKLMEDQSRRPEQENGSHHIQTRF
ncbi:unnamed protein product, partial [Urochloa humidicola]